MISGGGWAGAILVVMLSAWLDAGGIQEVLDWQKLVTNWMGSAEGDWEVGSM